MRLVPLVLLAFLLNAPGAARAKEFVNLDFDAGGIPSAPFDFLQNAEFVLPGWTARMGDHVQSQILWNNGFAEYGWVGVHSVGGLWGDLPQGRYSARLTAGPEYPSGGPTVPSSISQLGTIPQHARSLIFRSNLGYGVPTEIRFADQLLTPFLLGDPQHQPNWGGEWAVDVSKIAGREGVLSFTTFPVPNEDFGGMDIDSLRFSSTVTVPEPSAYAFGGIGLALLTWSQFKRGSPR